MACRNLVSTKILKQLDTLNKKVDGLLISKTNASELIVQARLLKMGFNRWDILKQIFKIPETCLTGGFIIQTILGEFWPTDLDIFTADANAVKEVLAPLGLKWESITNGYGYAGLSFNVVQATLVKNFRVEIIECKSVLESMNNFDFDFCKCYFDGDFQVMYPEALMTKTHDCSKHSCEDNGYVIAKDRRERYEIRGFNIINQECEVDDSCEDVD
jgi:hypothetical protein